MFLGLNKLLVHNLSIKPKSFKKFLILYGVVITAKSTFENGHENSVCNGILLIDFSQEVSKWCFNNLAANIKTEFQVSHSNKYHDKETAILLT